MEDGDGWADKLAHRMPWPLPNVWLGCSVENQKYADERIPFLIETPTAVRFLSYEPAIGPVDFADHRLEEIAWVIVGGESGPGARPFDLSWAHNVIHQCKTVGNKCFIKQLGANPVGSWRGVRAGVIKDSKGGDWNEWPEALRVRQWPEVRT